MDGFSSISIDADIHTLFSSDFYRVVDFRCRCKDCRESKPEYGEAFCISFVRKGNFLFNVFRRQLDSYTGCVLICKPEYERTITHTHAVPDECTIFEFEKAFYHQLRERYGQSGFFRDNDWHSALVRTSAEVEYLHYSVLRLAANGQGPKLLIDQLVMEIISGTLGGITEYRPDDRINGRLKRQHLATIESAKDYIREHFTRDLSLMELSTHCCVSPFHFSRLFSIFTGSSPHQYLLSIRLQHAALLLASGKDPVADVAYSCGFNSIEHFTAAFRKKYHCPPARYRERYEKRYREGV